MTEKTLGKVAGAAGRMERGIWPEMALIAFGAALLLWLLGCAADWQDETAQTVESNVAAGLLRREAAELRARVDDAVVWGADELRRALFDDAAEPSAREQAAARLIQRYGVTRALSAAALANASDAPGAAALADALSAPPLARLDANFNGVKAVAAALPVAVGGGLAVTAAAVLASPVAASSRSQSVAAFVRIVDPAALRRLGEEHGLRDLTSTVEDRASGRGVLRLIGADGAPLGALTWRPTEPGDETLRRVWPVVAGMLLTMGAAAGVALHRSSTSSTALRDAAQTVSDMNRELERNRRRFRDFAEAASDWFWETDADLRYIYMSERLAVVLEGEPTAIFGAALTDLWRFAADPAGWRAAQADIAARRPFRDLEIHYPAAGENGLPFVFRLSGQPCFGDDGAFAGYRGCGVDASAEALAVSEARNTQALTHDALDSISEGFVLFNADGRLALCNERYRQAYPNIADVLTPGVAFAEVLRVAAERGGFLDDGADIGSWVRQRLERHLGNPAPVDRRLSDGRWYRISEHATGSGGVVKLLMDITELKEREYELAGQTARLKATLDSISHGVGMFDHDGGLAAWNEDFPRLLDLGRRFATFGRSSADFAERAFALSPVLASAFSANAAAGDALPKEAIKAGERFLEVRRSAIPEGGFVVSLADVSERQRVDAALRDLAQSAPGGGEAFFRTLALALARTLGADAVWVGEMVAEGRVRLAGRVTDGAVAEDHEEYSLDGAPCGRVVGRSLCLFSRGVRGLFPSDPRLAAMGAESYCAAPLFDSGGRPLGHLAVLSRKPLESADFVKSLLQVFAARAAAEMERLRTINALRESEIRYRQLVELAPYGVAIWDRRAIRFANSAAARILGRPPVPSPLNGSSGLEGARLAPFFEDGDALEAGLSLGGDRPEGYCAENQERRMECVVVRPSGERRYLELGAYAVAFRGDDALLLVFNDITERRRAEAELQRSQKMEAVGRMAGGVAHEFNNMLTAIGGFARLAERNPADADRVVTCVREIAKASDRAAALTSQLLDFSRRRVTDELETVELGEMIRDLRVFLKPLISAGVDLDIDIRVAPLYAVANPVTLNQALLNLAINARDAMPDGGALTITLDRAIPDAALRGRLDKLPAGPCVMIRVADNGCGIADDVRDRIWEPFFTTKDLGKGTGLGLWMVYGAVEQAGGVIDLETEEGVGAVFSIYLPEAEASPENRGGWRESLLDDDAAACVLLVDDEESVRAYMRLTLEEAGCVVTEACDGVDALDKFDAGGGLFDLVVTDISMPHMNGADLAHALAERNPELRILFLTGYASRDKAAGLQARPGWRLLMKPIDPERLVESVRSLIRE